MKLFYAPPSPYARKVRIVARERGLMNRIEELVVNPYQDDARLLAANPAGLVPALVLDDGEALIDSPLICHYLDSQAAETGLIPTNDQDRWWVLQDEALADAVLDFAVAALVEKRRTDAPPSAPFIARKIDKIKRCLTSVDTARRNAITPTLGDITWGCALSYLDFRYADFDWRSLRPDLAPWHAAIEARPAFLMTQPAEHLG